jgi:hypothetical protein
MTPKEESRAGATESNVGLVDEATFLVWIDIPQRHRAHATCRYALNGAFPHFSSFGQIVALVCLLDIDERESCVFAKNSRHERLFAMVHGGIGGGWVWERPRPRSAIVADPSDGAS